MSEQRRAFLALQGRTFPRVGDQGRYVHNEVDLSKPDGRERPEAPVVVLEVSVSGLTVTVRFVDRWARVRFCRRPFRVHRRGEGILGSGWYLPGVASRTYRLTGEVVFGAGAAALPWRLG